MFCSECGTQNPDTNMFCRNCGKPFSKKPQASPAPAAAVPVQPVATPSPAQPVYSPPPPAAVVQPAAAAPVKPAGNPALSAVGIGSAVLAALSWFRYPYIFGLLAIVLGAIAFLKAEKKNSWPAILGILGIVAGLACIIVDIFYFTIFPTPHPDLT